MYGPGSVDASRATFSSRATALRLLSCQLEPFLLQADSFAFAWTFVGSEASATNAQAAVAGGVPPGVDAPGEPTHRDPFRCPMPMGRAFVNNCASNARFVLEWTRLGLLECRSHDRRAPRRIQLCPSQALLASDENAWLATARDGELTVLDTELTSRICSPAQAVFGGEALLPVGEGHRGASVPTHASVWSVSTLAPPSLLCVVATSTPVVARPPRERHRDSCPGSCVRRQAAVANGRLNAG